MSDCPIGYAAAIQPDSLTPLVNANTLQHTHHLVFQGLFVNTSATDTHTHTHTHTQWHHRTEFSLSPHTSSLPPEWIAVMSVPGTEYMCKWPNDA